MVYQFLNKFCPVCNKVVTPYEYTVVDVDGVSTKVHLECEEELG